MKYRAALKPKTVSSYVFLRMNRSFEDWEIQNDTENQLPENEFVPSEEENNDQSNENNDSSDDSDSEN